MDNKLVLLVYDLYFLRYEKEGEQWYELTDYLREKLVKDGIRISYDDLNKDIIFNGQSMKRILQS